MWAGLKDPKREHSMQRIPPQARQLLRAVGFLAASLIGPLAGATVYYVSFNGNDANNGTSQATPWRTIDRVNQITYAISAGDQILFQRGGKYRGEIIWGTSGSPSSPIVIGAYGTGDAPIIDGSVLVTSWSQHQGNVWKAYVGQQVDQVYVGGTRMTLARTPNSGWYRNDQGSGNTMHSANLTEANGFWTGARCVLRNTASSIDTLRVTGFTNGTLTFSAQPLNGNMGADDWGFYMEKRLDLLNAPNEWFYESSTGMLYLQAPGNADPNGLQVEASVHWSGIICYPGRHYLSVSNLTFQHQRNAGIRIDDADHVSITGCTFQYLYHGIRSYGHYNHYTNNTFSHTLATGCLMIDNNSTFEGNTLTDIAVISGEGESGWGYFGIRGIGPGNIIRSNTFDRVGYMPIVVDNDQLVEKNIMRHHLVVLNDGGAIAFDNTDGLTVQDNIIYDPICGLDGSSTVMPHYQRLGVGIYFGNISNVNVTVQRNTIANLPGVGINVDHNMNAHGHQIKTNTIFNCDIGMSISDYSNYNGPYAVAPYYVPNYDDVYSGNVIYGLTKDQIALRIYSCWGLVTPDYGTYTNNRYFNPYNEMGILRFSFQAGQKYHSVEEWQTLTGEETGTTRSSLHLNEYATVSQLSGDLIPGGDFTSNVTGWGGWPSNAQVTHNTAQLDNGCLKANLPNNTVYDNFQLRNPDMFSLSTGDWYRLDLSLKSDAPGQVEVGIKGQSQQSNPYTHFSRLVPFSSERRDLSMYFQVPVADQNQVQLKNYWTEPMYYLDNVALYKVQVQELDPLDKQILLINDQSTEQSFPLTGCWSDVNGVIHSGSISVAAFRSKVLVREADDLCLNTEVEEGASTADITGPIAFPNPVEAGGRITFTSAVSGMIMLFSAAGQVVASQMLSPGSLGMDIPSHVKPGVYALRIMDGSDRTERLVVE